MDADKRRSPKSTATKAEEMRAEYRFDYSKARPNRFASRVAAKALRNRRTKKTG